MTPFNLREITRVILFNVSQVQKLRASHAKLLYRIFLQFRRPAAHLARAQPLIYIHSSCQENVIHFPS